jgi:hypothetical protein
MSDNDDTPRREALLHARAVGAIEQALVEIAALRPALAEDVARALLARLARLPDPILLTTYSEVGLMESERDRLYEELADARLLLVRKSEALAIFADDAMWSLTHMCGWAWQGIADYADLRAFAARERDADTPDNRGG